MLHPAVADELDRLGAVFEILPCEPEFADTAAFCVRYGIDPADSANTILVGSKRPSGHVSACVALATTRLDVNRTVRDVMGVKKLSFASPEVTLEVSGMEIGGVTAFGLPSAVPVLVDSAVLDRPSVVLGGGNRTSKLRLAPDQLLRIPTVRVVPGLAVS